VQDGTMIFRLYKGRCTEGSPVSMYRSSFKGNTAFGIVRRSFDYEKKAGAMKTVGGNPRRKIEIHMLEIHRFSL